MSVESIRREIWLGEIPACFLLSIDDLACVSDEPEPCCLMLPRNSYLPLHTIELQSYFKQYVKAELKDSEIWFESDGYKVKWHVPIGVTYDMLCGVKTQGSLWNINVRFSAYPEQELLRCPSIDCVKGHFMSTLKEADSLKHGSVVMNGMRQPDHQMLWNGLLSRNFDEFWTINRQLMDCDESLPNGTGSFKHLPMRIYKPDKSYIQPYIAAVDDESSQEPILLDLLQSKTLDTEGLTVISQGIKIPLDSSIYKLCQTLSYPDNFLYICLLDEDNT